jgi:uncharacterized protein (DUF58 family)
MRPARRHPRAQSDSSERPSFGRGWALYWLLTAAWGFLGLLFGQWLLLLTFFGMAVLGVLVIFYRAGSRVRALEGLYASFGWRPTGLGWFFLLLVFVMFFAAFNTGHNLLYMIFAMMAATGLMALALSFVPLRGLRVTVTPPPPIPAGEPVLIPVRVDNRKRLLASYSLRIEPAPSATLRVLSGGYAPRIGTRRSAEARVRVLPRRRGVLPLARIRVSTGFPFGFARASRWYPTDAQLVVLPRMGRCTRLPPSSPAGPTGMSHRAAGPGDDEFHAIREYRPGDNPRRIHWRSTARAQRLMVREQRAVRQGVAIVVVAGAPHDLPVRFPAVPGERLDGVADVAVSLVAGLHAAGWDVHVGVAGERPQHLAVTGGRIVEGFRRLLVDWSGGPVEGAIKALPAGFVRGAAVFVVVPEPGEEEPAVALAHEHGAGAVEVWVPEDVTGRGWVDFGPTEPTWRHSPAAHTAAPSTT